MIRLLLLLFLTLVGSAQAAEMNVSAFGRIPIMHEGRIKPLSSFARFEYQHLTDENFVGGNASLRFLAQSLFDPAEAAEKPLFAIRSPQTRFFLGLEDKPEYALTDIVGPLSRHEKDVAAWLKQDPDELSPVQRDVLDLYDRMIGHTQILRTLTPVLPLGDALTPELRKEYSLPDGALSYFDLQTASDALRRDIAKLVKHKGYDADNYSDHEKAIAFLAYQIDEIRIGGQGNSKLRIIPTGWSADWVSPWDMLQTGRSSPDSLRALESWRGMAQAWRGGDALAFHEMARSHSERLMARSDVPVWRLGLERFYYAAHPLLFSLLLYALGLLCLARKKEIWARRLVWSGWVLHGAALLMRVLILMRPPVGTLFESVVFVGFIAVLCALLAESKWRSGLGLTLAGILGMALHMVSFGFAQDGDTLQTLQAVLNTPFWLATHVLVITAGYGLCLYTSLLAHADLWRRSRNRSPVPSSSLTAAAVASLLFTSIGTWLGGLWADQSWGRFWGWDPKENGALLIVLFLTWLLHGKLSGHIKDPAYSAGLATLAIAVALAWFGVNLLSTGLHSYGFIHGIANALFAYVALQAILIAALWHRARHAA